MLSKIAAKGLGVLGFGIGLVMIAVSFTIYVLTGQEMHVALALTLWLGLGLAGTGLVFVGTASLWPDDAVGMEPSRNESRRSRRNWRSGKRGA